MMESQMTSKGQVTVPAEIRRGLGLKPGDRLLFEVEGDIIRVRIIRARSLAELHGMLHVNMPFPGVRDVRREVGRKLGKEREESCR